MQQFIRISKDRCNIAIAWNTRKFDATPFMKGLKQLLVENASDYKIMKNKYWSNLNKEVKHFYKDNCDSFTFANFQLVLWEEFIGYLLSLSYVPRPNSPSYGIFIKAAKNLFDKYKQDNHVNIDLETKLYFGVIN